MGKMIPLGLAFVLTAIHYFSEHTVGSVKKYYPEITSFSAGIFITYIILEVFPELHQGLPFLGENVYLLMLLGFTAFHVAEKYLYQHIKNKKELLADLAHLHIAGFIADSFIVGFSLVIFFGIPGGMGKFGYLVFIPFVLHTLSAAISVRHIHEHFKSNKAEEFLLAFSTIGGALVATLLELKSMAFYAVFSLITGVLLYIVVRDLMPNKGKGRALYFMLGMALSLVLISIANLYG